MADRYFYGHRRSLLPQPNLEETKTQRMLRQLKPSEVTLHDIFLQPLTWHQSVAAEVDKITVVCNPKHPKNTPEYHLRRNILQMAHQTKDVGLLMTHYRWVGLLNMGQIRTIVSHGSGILSAITMYHMLLKKEPKFFTKFVNGLLITKNGFVGNAVEYSADILELHRGVLGKSTATWDSDLHFSMQRGKFLPENLRAIMYEQGAKYVTQQKLLNPSSDLKDCCGTYGTLSNTDTTNPSPSGHNTDIEASENITCDIENQTGRSTITGKNRNRSSGSRFVQVTRLFR